MVAALFVQEKTVYRLIPGVDCWPASRDARLYRGDAPVIAHPPCRTWGRYAHVAKPAPGERELAYYALASVRRFGGVLEHPDGSQLWRVAGLPRPGEPPDMFGGVTYVVNQCDWGHRARKRTYLYVCGAKVAPSFSASREPSSTVENMWKGEREATPYDFAVWLVHLAKSCARGL